MWIAFTLLACTEPETTYTFADVEQVAFTTSEGDFVLEVDATMAAENQHNFLVYVEEGFYDGADDDGATLFHRVVADFVVQGGGFRSDGTKKPTRDRVVNESGALNLRGTVAMARSNNPDSARSQFFVNMVDNPGLDAVSGADGYTVFGAVIEGMDTLDAIGALEVDGEDRPLRDVVIESAEIL